MPRINLVMDPTHDDDGGGHGDAGRHMPRIILVMDPIHDDDGGGGVTYTHWEA